MTPAEDEPIVVVPQGYEPRRAEITDAVFSALGLVRDFAARHGWSSRVQEPFFHRVEVYQTQESLWKRILELNEASDIQIPTDALTAALEKGILLAVTREEAERSRPEYFRTHLDWIQALAHEIVHRLHVRILNGDEEAMGPNWFFEGFAVVGSGQPLGKDRQVNDIEEALKLTTATGRGSYAHYAAAVRFFAQRIPLRELVAKAAAPDFESWLRAETRERLAPSQGSAQRSTLDDAGIGADAGQEKSNV